jgi:hypothetical protein
MPHYHAAWQLGLAIAIRSIATCSPLLLLLVLLLLMLMPMLTMFSLTLMLLLYAFDDAAYAAANDATNADAKMPNDARHLDGAYAVVLMPKLLRLLRLLMLVIMQCLNVCKGSKKVFYFVINLGSGSSTLAKDLARSIASSSANPSVSAASISFPASAFFHAQKKSEMGGGEGMLRAAVSCQRFAEMGGGEGLVTRYAVSCQKFSEIGREEKLPRAARKVAEMGRGERLTGYAVSCHEMEEMGGGEGLSRAAFTWQKMAGMRY